MWKCPCSAHGSTQKEKKITRDHRLDEPRYLNMSFAMMRFTEHVNVPIYLVFLALGYALWLLDGGPKSNKQRNTKGRVAVKVLATD